MSQCRDDLKRKYGRSDRSGLNRAIRAEIPGGGHLLDALPLLDAEAARPRVGRHPSQIRAIRETARAMTPILDNLRKAILETYGAGDGGEEERAKKETATRAVPVSTDDSLKSTPPATAPAHPKGRFNPRPPQQQQQATPAISLDALKPSTLGDGVDNRRWTPPQEIVALMGKIPDTKIHEMTGVSATLIREHRERLGIPPVKRGGRRPGAGRPPPRRDRMGTAALSLRPPPSTLHPATQLPP